MNTHLEIHKKNGPKGLTEQEVQALRKRFGKNEVVPSALNSGVFEFFKFLQDPMGLMMLTLALIYYLLDEKRDALIMLIAFFPVTAIDVFLELKAERALNALRSTFQMKAKVFRDGILKDLLIQDIVPEDWVALEEGQTVPADGILEEATNLSLNEAALTGESVPVDKMVQSKVFAGTSVIAGRGILKVLATGKNTQFGEIVDLLQHADEVKSPLQRKVNRLVMRIIKVAAVLVVCLFFLELARGKAFLESLLIAFTFGMASVPEEFPLVFTLYLSLGAWRLAKSGVLVKALPSVETLGSVNVICTDKTGTLTEGRFQMIEIIPFSNVLPDDLWRFAILACEPLVVDSMELAIKEKIPAHIDVKDWQLIHDYEFESEGKHMSHAWRNARGESLVAMKGAVEGVLSHCSDSVDLKSTIIKQAEALSSRGFRLLGLAGKRSKITGVRSEDESHLSFLGILTFSDPIRQSAKRAIEICQAEGIVVKMITGDHPLTAHAIADQLGLKHSHEALYTGSDLVKLSEAERRDAFQRGAIFSRVTPGQKYDLVKSLKEDGLVVAMTGDGVNDAPAMKIADISISMGANATDVARSTAKMVLTKSDFNGIVHAFTEGRRIFANLRRSFSYLIAFHVPVVLISFIPPLFNLGELLMPIHIILLELIVHPISAFTFENLEGGKGTASQYLINTKNMVSAVLSGVIVSLFALGLYLLNFDATLDERRTLVVVTVLFGNIGFVLLEAWPMFTKRLAITIMLLFGVTLATFKVPVFAHYFYFRDLQMKWIFFSLVLGLFASIPSARLRSERSRK